MSIKTTSKRIKKAYTTAKSQETREKMVKQYAHLVKWVVGRLPYIESGDFDREDLVGYGSIGLLEAIDRYNENQGANFESFAITRIRGAIFDYLRQRDILSRGGRQRVKKLNKARSELEVQLGRTPKDDELQAKLEISDEEYRKIQNEAACLVFSLDESQEKDSFDDSKGSLIDSIPSSAETQDEILDKKSLKMELAKAIDQLPERERLVVALYHYQQLTFKEIGAVLEVSESRASQLHMQAIQRLRSILKNIEL